MNRHNFEIIESHFSFGGTLQFLRFNSKTLGVKTNFGLYLPPQAQDGHKVPVIYALAGLTSNYENFLVKANALRFAAKWGIALVAPDTSPRDTNIKEENESSDLGTGAGFYLDATAEPWAHHYKMASFVGHELPKILEENFPLDPALCGIMGHSMGGMGALGFALRQPEKWKSVSAFAPICLPSRTEWGQKVTAAYFGGNKQEWQHYDPCLLLKAGHSHPCKILVDQGLNDEFLTILQPEALEETARQVNQPLTLRRHQNYDHSYWFVQSFIEEHIAHHASILTAL
ncbi:S-formylglutathione hydrolase [Aristophania vespae]|uniref:S-formylglutathione hydrolase n=1 Tax=Aristophania vespae TaxID=2697033 RepID=A0A6P1NAD5_9PROT|nr:S-formylglutathione hydrolase [Aristophania vespae]QHI95615.1 S-formylglutathione hydrolase [Aristophania vespae]UMM63282.1 S-formylglutathione hydrolase [Aristophania vespae]